MAAGDEILRAFFRGIADRGGVVSPVSAVEVAGERPQPYELEVVFLAGRAINPYSNTSFQIKMLLPGELLRPDRESDLAKWARAALKSMDAHVAEEQEKATKAAAKPDDWDERAPDLTERVVGFRVWKTNGENLLPWGQGAPVWRGAEEVTALCSAHKGHHAPAPNCHCGFNAWNGLSYVQGAPGDPKPNLVIGVLSAWGRVQVHADGFRAEHAKPLALGYDPLHSATWHAEVNEVPAVGSSYTEYVRGREWRDPSDRERIEELGEKLGLPVMPYDQLPAYAAEHGAFIPESLKP